MLQDLFDFKKKTPTELFVRMLVITAIAFVLYHIIKVVTDQAESFCQTNTIGNCDDKNTPNAGCNWTKFIMKQ